MIQGGVRRARRPRCFLDLLLVVNGGVHSDNAGKDEDEHDDADHEADDEGNGPSAEWLNVGYVRI